MFKKVVMLVGLLGTAVSAYAYTPFIGLTRYGRYATVPYYVDSLVAVHSDWGSDAGYPIKEGIDRILPLNPNWRALSYNSLTDNYDNNMMIGFEQAIIDSIAAANGWNSESAYVHFYDDTWIRKIIYQNNVPVDTLWFFFPGCGDLGPTQNNPLSKPSRIPITPQLPQNDIQSRKVTNFSTAEAYKLQMNVILEMAVNRHYYDPNTQVWSPLYPDGVFADNTGHTFYGFGGGDFSCWTDTTATYAAGHVWETAPGDLPNMLVMNSVAYVGDDNTPPTVGWHWSHNIGPFISALRDTLENAVVWHPDHRRKYLMINSGPRVSQDFITEHSADFLFHEMDYNPFRMPWFGPIVDHQWCENLSAAGIARVYAPVFSSGSDVLTWDQRYEGSLAYYLLVRSKDTLFHYQIGSTGPNGAGWDTMSWHPIAGVVKAMLGDTAYTPYVLTSGVDQLGQAYTIYARDYKNGYVVVRPKSGGNYTNASAVIINLPRLSRRVHAHGQIDAGVTTYSVPNARGFIFLDSGSKPPPPIDPPPNKQQNKPLYYDVYDLDGSMVRSHVAGPWNGRDSREHILPAGVYFCKWTDGKTRKILWGGTK